MALKKKSKECFLQFAQRILPVVKRQNRRQTNTRPKSFFCQTVLSDFLEYAQEFSN
jgi:hypothetical protein